MPQCLVGAALATFISFRKAVTPMSTPATPFADVQVTLDKMKHAWIEQMLALLGKAHAAGPMTADTSAPSAGQAPMLERGVPNLQFENVLDQQTTNALLVKKQMDPNKKPDEIKSNKPKDSPKAEDIPPVFQYPTRKRVILDADIRLVENTEYEKLPDDLKSKMTVDVWHEIKAQRQT